MNNISILHYDDNYNDINKVDAYVKNLMEYLKCSIGFKAITNSDEIINELETTKYDLLILDMYEGDKRIGEDILEIMQNKKILTKTIIYTTGSKADNQINYSEIKLKYSFLLGDHITKGDRGDELKARIKKYIFSQDKIEEVFKIPDIDDTLLEMEIKSIGKTNLNEILHTIRTKKNINEIFIVNRISAGLSGASIFKIDYGQNQTFILKISLKKDIIQDELERIDLFTKFPPFLKINYEAGLNLETDTVAAIVSEMLENSTTLFDWIKSNNKNKINKLLNLLYLEESLSDHYQKHKNGKEKYTFLFKKIIEKFSYVEKAFKELEPIFNHFNKIKFDFDTIRAIVIEGHSEYFKNINNNILLGNNYFKELILCHGDFHSQNILVKANRPTIIDTGGIGYDYWCLDAARLIVNLFIKGYDINKYSFFSIEEQIKRIEIAKIIIKGEKLVLDGVNDGYINAINWLNINLPAIYGKQYSKWEFQLGLCKEFLNISYKTDSLPPSKRVLALYAAYSCIIIADQEITKVIK